VVNRSGEEAQIAVGRFVIRSRGAVVELRPKFGDWDDLVAFCCLVVGTAGLVGIVRNPSSVAVWILGPFIVAFGAFGLWHLVLRLRGAGVEVDRSTWTARSPGVRVEFSWMPKASVVRSPYFAGGPKRRFHWAVELAGQGKRIRVANGLDERSADDLAAAIQRVLGAGSA